MNKKQILSVAAVTVLGAGILTASSAFAQNASSAEDPRNTLVQKIADKFKLDKNEVQAVFDEAHNERHTKMQAVYEQQLSQYVTDGKLTEEQKQLILEKHKEMRAEREANKDSMRNLSEEERRAKMEAKRAELEAWAKDNGIDIQYVMPKFGKGHGMGRHGFGGPQGSETPSTMSPTVSQ